MQSLLITELDHHNHLFLFSGIPTKVNAKLASPADILRGVSRIPVCGAGMCDAPLRMSAGEANAKYTLTLILSQLWRPQRGAPLTWPIGGRVPRQGMVFTSLSYIRV